MDAARLKARLKDLLDVAPEDFRVRTHRAISWLARSEQAKADPDVRFLLLWIAFNAAYAREFGTEQSEREQVRQFFVRVLEADAEKRLHQLLFQRFSGPIRTLIENRFIFEPFWRALREHDSSDRWEQSFASAKRLATTAVVSGDTPTLIGVVMDRLYVLRNQLVHGGATYASKVNRQQVADGAAILGDIVPLVLTLMLDAHALDYGAIEYPVLPSA